MLIRITEDDLFDLSELVCVFMIRGEKKNRLQLYTKKGKSFYFNGKIADKAYQVILKQGRYVHDALNEKPRTPPPDPGKMSP